jgi:hypothetical protein
MCNLTINKLHTVVKLRNAETRNEKQKSFIKALIYCDWISKHAFTCCINSDTISAKIPATATNSNVLSSRYA